MGTDLEHQINYSKQFHTNNEITTVGLDGPFVTKINSTF